MNKVAQKPGGLFVKRLPLSLGIILIIIFGLAGIYFSSNQNSPRMDSTNAVVPPAKNESITIRHQKGYELVQPLLITEVPEQSPNLFFVRDSINSFITTHKGNEFEDISIHLLKQNSGEWIGINSDKEYSSKGYLRAAVMITLLKMSEKNPNILNQKIKFEPASNAKYPELSLEAGKSYTINDMISKMMLTADTNPKSLLIPYVDKTTMLALYDGLGLGKPDLENKKFTISASGYSKLLNVIYNGRFLSEANSEYALKLLSNNNEREGILKLLPAKSKVVHKMNQSFKDNKYELRESGIIYCNDDAYLLTIFITGKDKNKLEDVCGDLGKLVYDDISK